MLLQVGDVAGRDKAALTRLSPALVPGVLAHRLLSPEDVFGSDSITFELLHLSWLRQIHTSEHLKLHLMIRYDQCLFVSSCLQQMKRWSTLKELLRSRKILDL